MAPAFIVTIVIIASLILVKMVLDYNTAKMLGGGEESDRSLPVSELSTLIRESVADEIRPLAERVEQLERRTSIMDDERLDEDESTEAGSTSIPARER